MRLICPNCGAQYEVPAEVVPADGRDVQCSNCGITWFQHAEGHDPAADLDEGDAPSGTPGIAADWDEPDEDEDDFAEAYDEADEPGTDLTGDPDDDEVPRPEAPRGAGGWAEPAGGPGAEEPEAPDDPDEQYDEDYEEQLGQPHRTTGGFARDLAWAVADEEDDETPEHGEEAEPDAPPVRAAARRRLDPEVRSVLQEEAAFEARLRTREADPLESQPDLGLGDPETEAQRRERTTRERLARLRGAPAAAEATTPAAPVIPPSPVSEDLAEEPAIDPEDDNISPAAPRRDLLPDIEEINSSLRTKGVRARPQPAPEAEAETRHQRRGFRLGFGIVLLVTAGLVLFYAKADWMAETFPALEGPTETYVNGANRFRFWLDGKAQNLQAWLDEMIAD